MKLAKAQRKLSLLEKGTQERRKQGKVVAKIHERIRNQRKDFCHKESKKIVDQYQYICAEDLDIKKMVEGSYLRKALKTQVGISFVSSLPTKRKKLVGN